MIKVASYYEEKQELQKRLLVCVQLLQQVQISETSQWTIDIISAINIMASHPNFKTRFQWPDKKDLDFSKFEIKITNYPHQDFFYMCGEVEINRQNL